MKDTYLLLILMMASGLLNGQDTSPVLSQEIKQDSSIVADSLSMEERQRPGIDFQSDDFNAGLIADPFLLLQGQTPGVQIYNLGGDPNVAAYVRVRGITSLVGSRQPLIVIDGIVNASLENLDVNDIEKITILKDGSATALYGIRASSGVVLITTKTAQTSEKLTINISGQNAISSVVEGIRIRSPEEYLQSGNVWDAGSATNWMEEINRRAISNVGHLALSGKSGAFDYRVAGNYRAQEGVLRHSGFDRWNTRANINGHFLQNKLKINLSAAYTQNKQSFSFREAYHYAIISNPTAPIFGSDAIHAFNSEQYGGYYEMLYAFNQYNPLSIVEQSRNIGIAKLFNISSAVNYDLSEKLSLNVRFGNQSRSANQRKYYPTTANYQGNASSAINKGKGEFSDSNNDFVFLETYLNYKITTVKSVIAFTAGVSHQSDQLTENAVVARGFENDEIDLYSDVSVAKKISEATSRQSTVSIIPDEKTTGLLLNMDAAFNEKVFLNATVRGEESSLLGSAKKRGIFTGLSAGFELADMLGSDKIKQFRPRLGYGLTGGVPRERGLAFEKFRETNYGDTIIDTRIVYAANDELTWEGKSEISFGVAVSSDRFHGSLDLYSRSMNNLISLNYVDPTIHSASRRNENFVELKSTGLELSLGYEVIRRKHIQFTSSLNVATFKTILKKHIVEQSLTGYFSGPGFGSTQPILVREGEEIGNIWGSVFDGVDMIGEPVYADVNGDGVVNSSGDPLDPDYDATILGNALPDAELGWLNVIKVKNWELAFLFRGAFGHSKINSHRIFNEVISDQFSIYNSVNTELSNPAIKIRRFHSLYVEKADFVKLEYIKLSKAFSIGSGDQSPFLRCSLVGQNLLTFTNYTGTDPEPVLADFQYEDNPDELAPGIDRRVQYYPSRTISLRVELQF